MPSCEKCWRDSNDNVDEYARLIRTRECTPEEQAGLDAKECPSCKRKTIHIYCNICTNCDYSAERTNVNVPEK